MSSLDLGFHTKTFENTGIRGASKELESYINFLIFSATKVKKMVRIVSISHSDNVGRASILLVYAVSNAIE